MRGRLAGVAIGFGAALAVACFAIGPSALAQSIDCNSLAAQIAAASTRGGGGGQYAAAAGKQRAELARMSGYANSLGCDKPDFFLFGNRPPQCAGLNGQIARMQANLQSLSQAASYGGDGARAALQQRFDTYCRGASGYGGAQNFFEQLFGGNRRPNEAVPDIMVPAEEDGERDNARGGSQALCVRSCDGGYFPMSVTARRRDLSDLQDLCTALCPGTEARLFTRVPGREVSTAVAVNGERYADLPNALKFEKAFDKTCTCKPADKSWVEALSDAERLLGEERRGDIVVTPERAEELSRLAGPSGGRERGKKSDPRTVAKAGGGLVRTPGAAEELPPLPEKDQLRGPTTPLASGGEPKRAGDAPPDLKPKMRVIAQ